MLVVQARLTPLTTPPPSGVGRARAPPTLGGFSSGCPAAGTVPSHPIPGAGFSPGTFRAFFWL